MEILYNVLKVLKQVVIIGLLCSLIYLFGFFLPKEIKSFHVDTVNAVLNLDTDLQTSVSKITSEVSKTRTDVLKTAKVIGTDSISRSLNVLDNRLASIQSDLNQQLAVANDNLNNQLTLTNRSIFELTSSYQDVPRDVHEIVDNFTPYINCKINGLCWQNQISDNLFAARTASRDLSALSNDFRSAFPPVLSNIQLVSSSLAVGVPKFVTSADSIAANVQRLTNPHWYDRLLGYAMTGSVIYRFLNPATIPISIIGSVVK